MAIENISIWTCTRCKKEERLGYGSQPKNWLGLVFVNPPNRAIEGEQRQHLCEDCDTEFAKFLYPDLPRGESSLPSTLE